jgi:hypothetical protein
MIIIGQIRPLITENPGKWRKMLADRLSDLSMRKAVETKAIILDNHGEIGFDSI